MNKKKKASRKRIMYSLWTIPIDKWQSPFSEEISKSILAKRVKEFKPLKLERDKQINKFNTVLTHEELMTPTE